MNRGKCVRDAHALIPMCICMYICEEKYWGHGLYALYGCVL
jgi:hypothetical protein